MQLTLVFLVPAIVHIVLRGLAGELSRRWFVVLLVVALTLQFSFGAEVFVSFTLFAASLSRSRSCSATRAARRPASAAGADRARLRDLGA